MQPRYHEVMETQATTVRLPVELHELLRREAFEKRTSQAAIITEALSQRYGVTVSTEEGQNGTQGQ